MAEGETAPAFTVRPARGERDMATVAALVRAYVDWLGIDLAFQQIEEELAGLPGKYAPPRGELFLAWSSLGEPLGCIGVRPWESGGACEVKRLYVRPEGRGLGVGRALADAAVSFAAAAGFEEMLLDTLPSMPAAIALYRQIGFEPIPPYWNNIVPGVLYFAKRMRPDR